MHDMQKVRGFESLSSASGQRPVPISETGLLMPLLDNGQEDVAQVRLEGKAEPNGPQIPTIRRAARQSADSVA